MKQRKKRKVYKIQQAVTGGEKTMRVQRQKYTLRWLITPEDSSSWEAGGIGDCTNDQNKRKSVYSISKLLIWYLVALVIPIFLSRLH